MNHGENARFPDTSCPDLFELGLRRLAEFRRRIRQSLYFREAAAHSKRIEPQQHQVLVVFKGRPKSGRPATTLRAMMNHTIPESGRD